jgi:hypothetical protein
LLSVFKHIFFLIFICIGIANAIPVQSLHECNNLVHNDDEIAFHESHDLCLICDHISKQNSDPIFSHNFELFEQYIDFCNCFKLKTYQTQLDFHNNKGPPSLSFS